MNEILVSINCITYNHEKYISEALDSFLMQKVNFRYEILIHDDASTDKTAEIILEYYKKYPDIIKPILQKENQLSKGIQKISYSFNHTRAKGKYIALCEGDDYWTDEYKLQKQVDYMEEHPDCSLCFHAADIYEVGKGKIGEVRPYTKNCISPTEDIILGDGGFMATNSILYRKTSMDNAPEFFLNAPVGDYPLQIITSTKVYAFYINDIMSVYRVGVEGSWTSRMDLKEHKIYNYISLKKNIAKMLMDIDKHYNGIYTETIQRKILEDEIEGLILTRRIKEIKTSYKSYYQSLNFFKKIKISLRCYIPDIYIKLAKIKRNIISVYK